MTIKKKSSLRYRSLKNRSHKKLPLILKVIINNGFVFQERGNTL